MVIFIVRIFFICLVQKKTCIKKYELHKKVCESKDSRGVLIPSEDTKILEFNQYQISHKTLSIIYENLESLIKN